MQANAPVSTEMAGDLFGMFDNILQAEALMRDLVTRKAQDIWVKRGGAKPAPAPSIRSFRSRN